MLESCHTILQSCLEEYDEEDPDLEFDDALLEMLLTAILPSSKVDNPIAYHMVSKALRATSGLKIVHFSMTSFVNNILVGTNSMKIGRYSDIAEHVYAIIFELNVASPSFLTRIIPNLCVQLLAEDENIRLQVSKLLGNLFASSDADYGKDFAKSFRDYLGRLFDSSLAVRTEVTEACGVIMKKKPFLASYVEGSTSSN